MLLQDETWIKGWLEREISLMRELLSNLLQEETALMLWDGNNFIRIVEERSQILNSIQLLRQAPKILGEPKLQNLLETTWKTSECELQSLKDKILTLSDKMSAQTIRNQRLFAIHGHKLGCPLRSHYVGYTKNIPLKRLQLTTLEAGQEDFD